MNATSPTPHLDALRKDGFVKITGMLSTQQLQSLRASCEQTTEQARQGKWPYVRTVPKQYPPWHEWQPEDNIWGVQHLLHPDMAQRNAFAKLYFSDEVLSTVKELVGLKEDPYGDDQLVMELFNLLVSPAERQDFELCWHRDDVRPDVTTEDEEQQLKEKSPEGKQLHAQYNIALFDDASLVVVPGSHRRIRTDEERNAAPFEPNMPGQVVVEMKPGDAVFYNSNILHRGVYKGIDTSTNLGRMTLHGSIGLAGHGSERARQVSQDAVGQWIGRAQFDLEGSKGERAEAMRQRLVEMGNGEGLGYSLVG